MVILIIVGLTKGSMLKGLISASLAFLCAAVGLDKVTGLPRLWFGVNELYDSLPLLPVVLGLFAVSQLFLLASSDSETIVADVNSMEGGTFIKLKDHYHMLFNNLRSAIIGTVVGIIPAAGTTVAAGLSYNIAKRTDKHPETFGEGNPQGLASVSAANNAVVGGSMVPLLTLGIPGNGTSALFLGGLLIHGLSPGAQLFVKTPEIAYGLIFGLILANVFILILGLFGASLYAKVTIIPTNILIPIVGSFIILGAYASRQLVFDMYLILFFGIVGYYMIRAQFSMAPFVLAFVLGKIVETQFRRALALYGGMGFLEKLTHPLALALLSVNILFFFSPFWPDVKAYIKRKTQKAA